MLIEQPDIRGVTIGQLRDAFCLLIYSSDLFMGACTFQPVSHRLVVPSSLIRPHQRFVVEYLFKLGSGTSRSCGRLDLYRFGIMNYNPWSLWEPSREDAIIIETIIRGSLNVIPVKYTEWFFCPWRLNEFLSPEGFLLSLRLIMAFSSFGMILYGGARGLFDPVLRLWIGSRLNLDQG